MDRFTARISAVSLIPLALSRLAKFTPANIGTHQNNLVSMFLSLCGDETPVVRKVAAQHLGQVAKDVMALVSQTNEGANIKQGTIPNDVLKVFSALANDDQVH